METGETQSAVSWDAVIAGAVASLAATITLSAAAAGLGMKMMPWLASKEVSFTPLIGAAMIVVQVLSAGLGGYLAGRLRTRWLHVHGHEVHFRDTAHGLLVWASSTVMGVLLAVCIFGGGASEQPLPSTDPAALAAAASQAAEIGAQASLFMAVGLLLSGFIAAVAAAIGGMRRDEMVGRL